MYSDITAGNGPGKQNSLLYRNTIDILIKGILQFWWREPRYDKTNKISVRPAKTQISLGIRPVWSESSLSAWKSLGL